MVTLLVTYNDIVKIKPFNENVQVERVKLLIEEIQETDIRQLLGNDLYFYVLDNLSSYADLINGSSFQCGDETHYHRGLKYVVAYKVHARWAREGGFHETYSGYVLKNNEDSVKVSDGHKKNLENNFNSIADSYWRGVKDYLNELNDQRWNCSIKRSKISRIQRNDKF